MPSTRDGEHADVIASVLEPRSVAVIGASDDTRKPGARVLRNLQAHRYPGTIFPINRRASEVQGLPSYSSVAALPEVPDLAIIAVPESTAVESLRSCGEIGVRTVVMLTAIDQRDAAITSELRAVIREHPRTHVIGPNSLGVHSAYSRLAASFMTATDADFDFDDSDIFIVAQSGGVGAYLLSEAERDGLAIAAFVSTGMELDLSFTDTVTAAIDRYRPSLLFAYLEGAYDHGAVARALERAHDAGVPVVLLRAGSTPAGRAAVVRHNGFLPWDDREWNASIDPSGALTARSIPEAVDLGRALAHPHAVSGARVTIVAASGGAAILMTDAAVAHGLEIAHWSDEQRTDVGQLLPSHAVVDNPIDATGALFTPLLTMRRLLHTCLEHPGTDIVVLTLGNMPHVEERLFDEIAAVAAAGSALLVVVWSGGRSDAVRRLAAKGVLAFSDPVRCARALRRRIDHPVRSAS